MTYQLSPHFTLEEMCYSETANAQHLANIPTFDIGVQLCLLTNNTMERIRSICGGNPVLVTSGYRCPALNEEIGGAENSAHLYGCANDFTIPAFGSVRDVCHAIMPHLVELEIDQLIYENNSWVHVGRAPAWGTPRHQCLTINGGTTTQGIA